MVIPDIQICNYSNILHVEIFAYAQFQCRPLIKCRQDQSASIQIDVKVDLVVKCRHTCSIRGLKMVGFTVLCMGIVMDFVHVYMYIIYTLCNSGCHAGST